MPPTRPQTRRAGGRRGRLVAGSAVAALLVAGTAVGAYLLVNSGGDSTHDKPVGNVAAAFPESALFVRIDTEPGWPRDCHADIGTYKAGDANPRPLVRGPKCDILPVKSPDGRQVAFTRRDGDRNEAWVMNADGSRQHKVTDIAGGRLTWSPDGARLAYMGEKDGVRQIFTITLQGKAVTQLTTDSSDKDDPMWAPVASSLVFWSKRDGGTEQLYTLDPDRPSAAWTRLKGDGQRAVDPAWSPDGSQIAYTHGESSASDIWLMEADGSNPRPLVKDADNEMDPGWSRNGKWICYVRGPVAKPRIWAVRADGTGDRAVNANLSLGHPNW